MEYIAVGQSNICWDCGRNIAECPWLHEGKPVEGWTAKKVIRKFGLYEPGPGSKTKTWETRKRPGPGYSTKLRELYEK